MYELLYFIKQIKFNYVSIIIKKNEFSEHQIVNLLKEVKESKNIF